MSTLPVSPLSPKHAMLKPISPKLNVKNMAKLIAASNASMAKATAAINGLNKAGILVATATNTVTGYNNTIYATNTATTVQLNAWISQNPQIWNNSIASTPVVIGPTTQVQLTPQGATATPLPLPAPLTLPVLPSFNKYVSASDLVEEFIAYVRSEGIRKGEVMDLPVELFIKWLIIRACEVDQEEPGIVLALPAPRSQPRCLGCGRWMVRTAPLLLHGDRCARLHFSRQAA